MRLNPDTLARVRDLAAMIRDDLGDEADDVTLADTIDGELDTTDLLARIVDEDSRELALAEAEKARADALKARASRRQAKSRTLRRMAVEILSAMNVQKVDVPEGTVSLRQGRMSVDYTDKDAVPTQLCRIKREPDSTAIRKLLEAGEDVPGAALVRGDDYVQIGRA